LTTGAYRQDPEQRVLVLAPTRRDATLVETVLSRAGIVVESLQSVSALSGALEAGAAAVILPEEAAFFGQRSELSGYLDRQPPWSDLPVIVLSRPGADSALVAQAMDTLGNVTVLERPVRIAALVSATRSALRARRRQYQIREHLVERERAADALRDADRRKDEFLAILAHELRNPLAPIRNALNVLRMAPSADSTRRRVVEMMERQVSHMVRLVDDLLEVSRITRGKVELKRQTLDLASVVAYAVETSRPVIDDAGHTLTVSLPKHSIAVRGDKVRLAQVFANLLNNAAKYTEPPGRIELVVDREDGNVVVRVRDNGIGIPPDMLSKVFDLFRQVDGVNRAHGGLGIGLTIVKSLVGLHGGTIEARSAGSGAGSEFIVRLPEVAPADSERDGDNFDATRIAAPQHVRAMVIDDNRDAAESLAMLLETLGADVRLAVSGSDGLAQLEDFRPEVVFLDIGMPDMNGYEVARQVRARPDSAACRLVALTGWGQAEDRERTAAAGFDAHVVKPADLEQLKSLLAMPRAALRH
jgi:signal transduction histidine kinase/CheY-like chemotaxis protein